MQSMVESFTSSIEQITASQQANVQPIQVNANSAVVSAGIEKPTKFKGDNKDVQKQGEEARRFLAAFKLYASTQPALNVTQADGTTKRIDWQWIASCLSFMDGEAADWALPFRDQIGDGKQPFQTGKPLLISSNDSLQSSAQKNQPAMNSNVSIKEKER